MDKKIFLDALRLNLFLLTLGTHQKGGDRWIIGWRPRSAQPKYWTGMPNRFSLLDSCNNCCLFAFDYDLSAHVLAHVEVRYGNTLGEGRICAA